MISERQSNGGVEGYPSRNIQAVRSVPDLLSQGQASYGGFENVKINVRTKPNDNSLESKPFEGTSPCEIHESGAKEEPESRI